MHTDEGTTVPVGGTTVLFEALLTGLAKDPSVGVRVINSTNRAGIWPRLRWALRTAVQLPFLLPRCDVVAFHASSGRARRFGPVVWLLCKLFRKKSLFHVYGGSMDQVYEALPRRGRWLLRHTGFRADAVLLETKMTVKYFRQRRLCDAIWLANFRAVGESARPRAAETGKAATRFVFLGQVRPHKGLRVLIEACKELDDDLTVDVYGPLMDGMTEADFHGSKARYRGAIPPNEVPATLQRYDVLVLPTHYGGEGYPGVLLEAYSVGMPVITTRWRAIPEIVDETSGVLIDDPHSATALIEAIRELARRPERLATLREGARRKARELSAEVWVPIYVKILRDLVAR
jgi:glycosyltransferase involved in cell wall biosynthesis